MPLERIVYDEPEPCPYLEGKRARMPLRWQFAPVTGEALDASLAAGDRRVGRMLYRTACPDCEACEPIRIPVDEFVATKSQRRVMRRNADLVVTAGRVSVTQEHIDLFNRHKFERDLARREEPMTRKGYAGWLQNTCTDTIEMQYRHEGRLLGVGILDVGERDASSVYFYFDPDEHKRSLGVFSVLVEVGWLRQRGGRHHYLGLYVQDCRALNYKAKYFPHERRIDDGWERFERP